MNYFEYTQRQTQIIEGEIPIWKVSDCELNRILAKAQISYDGETIEFVQNEFKIRGHRIYTLHYNSADKDALEDVSKADSIDLRHALTTARFLGDIHTGFIIEAELAARGVFKYNIDGYTPIQANLIMSGSLEKTHVNALKGLLRTAVDLADEDVARWVDDMRSIRKSVPDYLHKYDVREKHVIEGTLAPSRLLDTELERFAMRARVNGDAELVELAEAETQRRVLKTRELKFTKEESAIISGEKPIFKASYTDLGNLSEKLTLHDKHPELREKISQEREKREEEWKKRNRRKAWYSDEQLKIILGETPIFQVKQKALEALMKKAEALNDLQVRLFVSKELNSRKYIINDSPYSELEQLIIADIQKIQKKKTEQKKQKSDRPEPRTLNNIVRHLRDEKYFNEMKEYKKTRPYSKREMQIINGDIVLSDVRRTDLTKLAKKARAHDNIEAAERIEAYLQTPLQPYSAEQRDIIRGDIPYERISRTQIKNIVRKARELGDLRVISLMDLLMAEKIRDEKTAGIEFMTEKVQKDVNWAMDILESRIDPTCCTMQDLQNLRLFASTLEDPVYLQVADYLIEERKDPSIVYKTHTWTDTIELLQEASYMPISMPEDCLKHK